MLGLFSSIAAQRRFSNQGIQHPILGRQSLSPPSTMSSSSSSSSSPSPSSSLSSASATPVKLEFFGSSVSVAREVARLKQDEVDRKVFQGFLRGGYHWLFEGPYAIKGITLEIVAAVQEMREQYHKVGPDGFRDGLVKVPSGFNKNIRIPKQPLFEEDHFVVVFVEQVKIGRKGRRTAVLPVEADPDAEIPLFCQGHRIPLSGYAIPHRILRERPEYGRLYPIISSVFPWELIEDPEVIEARKAAAIEDEARRKKAADDAKAARAALAAEARKNRPKRKATAPVEVEASRASKRQKVQAPALVKRGREEEDDDQEANVATKRRRTGKGVVDSRTPALSVGSGQATPGPAPASAPTPVGAPTPTPAPASSVYPVAGINYGGAGHTYIPFVAPVLGANGKLPALGHKPASRIPMKCIHCNSISDMYWRDQRDPHARHRCQHCGAHRSS